MRWGRCHTSFMPDPQEVINIINVSNFEISDSDTGEEKKEKKSMLTIIS